MTIQADDFVIFRDAKKRKHLLQVASVDGDTISGTLDKNRAYDPQQAQFHKKEIVAVLGPNPQPGSVYGVNIEPYRRTIKHPDWGDIHVFVRLTKGQWLAVKGGLDRAYNDLRKDKLHGLVEAGNLSVEIRPPKGKNMGMYYYVQKGDNANDRFIIRVRDEGTGENHPDLYRELAHHEMGHGLTWRGMTKKMRARWIRLHAEFCSFTEHTAEDVKKIGKRFTMSLSTVKDFRATLEDEEAVLFDSCLGQIAADYRVTGRDIDWLIEGEDYETVKSMWPTQELRYSDFEEALGEYAMTNWREFIAEAFRIKHTKTKMPQRIDALLTKAMQMAPTIIGKTE